MGTGPGQFNMPSGLAFDPLRPYLYISGSGNNRVQVFEVRHGEAPRYVMSFGELGDDRDSSMSRVREIGKS